MPLMIQNLKMNNKIKMDNLFFHTKFTLRFKFVLIAVFMLFYFTCYASQNKNQNIFKNVKVDSSKIQIRTPQYEALTKYYNDTDFLYDRNPDVTISLWNRIVFWIADNILRTVFSNSTVVFWKITIYLFIAAVFIFVLSRLFNTNISGLFYQSKQQLPIADFKDIGQHIQQIDFDKEIANQIQLKKYRLAVRLLYLKTLKQIAQLNLIEWKADKTNEDYLNEIGNQKIRIPFRDITKLFTYVWYGNFLLNDHQFEIVHQAFQNFSLQLNELA